MRAEKRWWITVRHLVTVLPQRQTSTRTRNSSHNTSTKKKAQHFRKQKPKSDHSGGKAPAQAAPSTPRHSHAVFNGLSGPTSTSSATFCTVSHFVQFYNVHFKANGGNFSNAHFHWRCFANSQKWLFHPFFWIKSCSRLVIIQSNVQGL